LLATIERAPTKIDSLGERAYHEVKDGLHARVAKVDLIELLSYHVKSEKIILKFLVSSHYSVGFFSLQRRHQGQSRSLVYSSKS
jgi:hypothetical protein